MKTWVQKLLRQFDYAESDIQFKKTKKNSAFTSHQIVQNLSDEKATLLFILDILQQHLFETDKHNPRKVRDKIDLLSQSLIKANSDIELDKSLTEIRHFYNSYRIDEFAFVQTSFDDFKRIIWDFVEQVSFEIENEKVEDERLQIHLEELKEAVESPDIEELRRKSHDFFQAYAKVQNLKKEKRNKKITHFKKNLDTVKKQLLEAHQENNTDHMTGAFNRKCFEAQLKKYVTLNEVEPIQLSLIILDIDHFKKVNDVHGHDVGDFVIKECVNALKKFFNKPNELVARIGGEEFVVILPNHKEEHAMVRIEEVMNEIRQQKYVQNNQQLSYTISVGIAELKNHEKSEEILKRADNALYYSKNNGRNRLTVSSQILISNQAA